MEDFTSHDANEEPRELAPQSKFATRLHDAITAFLLLVAFPFGFALLALSFVFGRSLPRSASALLFLGILHTSAIVNILMGGTAMAGMFKESPGLLPLVTKGISTLLPSA